MIPKPLPWIAAPGSLRVRPLHGVVPPPALARATPPLVHRAPARPTLHRTLLGILHRLSHHRRARAPSMEGAAPAILTLLPAIPFHQ